MTENSDFEKRNLEMIKAMGTDVAFAEKTRAWLIDADKKKYSYNFRWLGLPIIQYPQDIIAMQELIWEIKPDLIIETGIARGGSLIFYASLLELIGKGTVLSVDIDIRSHNRQAIESHPLAKRIQMIEGSSIDDKVASQIIKSASGKKRVLVSLDSHHTHEHVLAELQIYAPLVTVGSYCVVFDTIIENLPANSFADREWDIGNNPMTAVHAFLEDQDDFLIDTMIEHKLQISAAPSGYLKRIK